MVEPKGSILLVYFVADESGSMGRNIDELNEVWLLCMTLCSVSLSPQPRCGCR